MSVSCSYNYLSSEIRSPTPSLSLSVCLQAYYIPAVALFAYYKISDEEYTHVGSSSLCNMITIHHGQLCNSSVSSYGYLWVKCLGGNRVF
jgi:hypothetical protein